MSTIELRMTAGEDEAFRIADLLERAFDGEGPVVTREETPAYSRIWTVSVLFFDATPEEAVEAVRDVTGSDAFGIAIEVREIDETTNWVAKSLEILKPVRAGRFLVHGSHDRAAVRGADVGLEIDAEMAFGTGHHATTAGCLLALDRLLKCRRPRRVLDLGTGTGILAFAVAKAARVPVLATDIDPVATAIAATNARVNGVGPLLRTATAAGLGHPAIRAGAPYDLLVANILARPLMALARPIAGVLAPGASVVLSGLRASEETRVAFAYRAQGLTLVGRILRDEWATLIFRRGGRSVRGSRGRG